MTSQPHRVVIVGCGFRALSAVQASTERITVTIKATRLDMTMMFAMHDALRRELVRIAEISARPYPDPRQVLRTAIGWEMLKSYLRVHHTSEDEALWPAMSQQLAGREDGLALMEAMESEHAAIDPLLNAIDAAVADPDGGPERLGDLTDGLATALSGHLKHEEAEALPLIDATLPEQQWQHFTEVHRSRIGADVPQYLPWLLDSASPASAAAVLNLLPLNVRGTYTGDWQPAYTGLELWSARPEAGA
jgi:hemerythrin-like domain-containing protein